MLGWEGNNVLGDTVNWTLVFAAVYRLQYADGRGGLPVKTGANVVGMGSGAVLEQVFPRLRHPRQILQVSQLVYAGPEIE